MRFSVQEKLMLWVLLTFAAFFLLWGLGESPLIDWDENIYAEASRQMVERQNYLNIYVNDHPFAEKPPFFFWEQALSYQLFGINESAARLPSALAGLAMVVVCFYFGRWLDSARLGALWALVYLTSFLPALFARSAVIDHTFNLFITLAALAWYRYDFEYRYFLNDLSSYRSFKLWQRKDLCWLTGASLAMGLAVLTKGPLGGVIPLVAWAGLQLWHRRPRFCWPHFIYAGIVSLTVALTWYLLNLVIYGPRFVQGFLEFQMALFSKPLEGHQAPFFYHWLMVLLGLFPWTPFLFLFRRSLLPESHAHALNLWHWGLTWVVFVLVLFSCVSTKLPHYSASVYVPLSLAIAWVLAHYSRHEQPFPAWVLKAGLGSSLLMGFALGVLPWGLEAYWEKIGPGLKIEWSNAALLTGLAWIAGGLGAWKAWQRRKVEWGIALMALAILGGTWGFWRWQIPIYLQYVQQPMLQMVHEAHQRGAEVVFYRYVSFAALFYGKRPIEMLHTYKFPGNAGKLNQRHPFEIFVITERKYHQRLIHEHPLVQHVRNQGTFALFVLPKQEK